VKQVKIGLTMGLVVEAAVLMIVNDFITIVDILEHGSIYRDPILVPPIHTENGINTLYTGK
jgi:hypothetical protein